MMFEDLLPLDVGYLQQQIKFCLKVLFFSHRLELSQFCRSNCAEVYRYVTGVGLRFVRVSILHCLYILRLNNTIFCNLRGIQYSTTLDILFGNKFKALLVFRILIIGHKFTYVRPYSLQCVAEGQQHEKQRHVLVLHLQTLLVCKHQLRKK